MSTETESKPLKAVIYADGGCRPSRGIGGWGIHGYFFYDTPAKVGAGCKQALPTAVGYQLGEGGKPPITITKYVDGFGSLVPEVTNNIAELQAATQALQSSIDHGVIELRIMTDSQYVKQGMEEWYKGWINNHWIKHDGTPVPNADRWKIFLSLKEEFEASGGVITCVWVKGHDGEFGNTRADANATRGVIVGRNIGVYNHLVYTDPQGYWNPRYEKNRFFSHRNWYFTTQEVIENPTIAGRHPYYLGDPGDEDEFTGKPISDATFSVLYLKEPEPALEMVRQSMKRATVNDYHGLMVGRLDRIFESSILQDILEHNGSLFQKDEVACKLSTPFNLTLAEERTPAGLAFKAIDALESLERSLQEYLNPRENTLYCVTDVTNFFYETIEGKKTSSTKLHSAITPAVKSIDINVLYSVSDELSGTTKLVLTIGQDLPDRNTLAAIATNDIKVSVVTWPESKQAIRFATVIEIDGNVGIWSGIYANLHFLES